MDDNNPNNWRGMFEQGRTHGRSVAGNGMNAPPPPEREEPPDDDALTLDLTDYKPWVLQRGRSRPTMLLNLCRYEAKSGMWMGWQLSYPHLSAVEYIGDKMLSLDFGTRQFVIEGSGLDELVRHLQAGTVMAMHEYAASVWPKGHDGPWIRSIRRLGPPEGGPQGGR
jgi:hypothetical protein